MFRIYKLRTQTSASVNDALGRLDSAFHTCMIRINVIFFSTEKLPSIETFRDRTLRFRMFLIRTVCTRTFCAWTLGSMTFRIWTFRYVGRKSENNLKFEYCCFNVIGYFIYVLYPHKMSLASPVFALIEYSMDSPVW